MGRRVQTLHGVLRQRTACRSISGFFELLPSVSAWKKKTVEFLTCEVSVDRGDSDRRRCDDLPPRPGLDYCR